MPAALIPMIMGIVSKIPWLKMAGLLVMLIGLLNMSKGMMWIVLAVVGAILAFPSLGTKMKNEGSKHKKIAMFIVIGVLVGLAVNTLAGVIVFGVLVLGPKLLGSLKAKKTS